MCAAQLVEPGSEEALDIDAAAGVAEAALDALALDHHEGGEGVDPEAPVKIGTRARFHALEHERLVVPAALEYLRDESVDAAAASGRIRVEENEPRAPRRSRGGDG
jgi:hypothetical protein